MTQNDQQYAAWAELAVDYLETEQKFLGGPPAIFTPEALKAKAAMSMLGDAQENLWMGNQTHAYKLINGAKVLLNDIAAAGNLWNLKKE